MAPSFLSKVFGRKKQDKKDRRASDSSLLEGKFEAVQLSPTAAEFGESNGRGGLRADTGFGVFRSKSRPTSADMTQPKSPKEAPLLSLNLPGPKEEANARALGVVFEADPDSQILLPEAIIGERRLSPRETLILVRACSQAITARGLETLGIMHPHWYSASPEIQRRLISLFIQSLGAKSPVTTLTVSPASASSAFESEVQFTRSPHDVAAVLRWGLRHLQIEGDSFGKDAEWYKTFYEAERVSSYPPKAFSELLVPRLPEAHLELLQATLEILSSLAAHSEANSISGSKLSRFLGLWLLTSHRTEENDDWPTFYARWERAGRILEHLFLSRIRDEAVDHRMPTRLSELVHHYPYTKSSSIEDTDLLPRPRFSTRRYDALFVRVDTQLSASAITPKHRPLRLIADAFVAEPISDSNEFSKLWARIKADAATGEQSAQPDLSRIFADETIRFLSLISTEASDKEPLSPTFQLYIPQRAGGPSRRRSFSMSDKDQAVATAAASSATNGHNKGATEPLGGTDWAQFSTTGFVETSAIGAPLAATLFDTDIEVTQPPLNRRPSLGRGRKSLDNPAPKPAPAPAPPPAKPTSRTAVLALVQLDEAFIDFWSDALLDPLSAAWPAFVVCKLKQPAPVQDRRVEWVVIEQAYRRPPPPPPTLATNADSAQARKGRPSSPKPSFRSELSNTRKRFSFFSPSRPSLSQGSEKPSKGKKKAQAGEMGEVLAEEEAHKEASKSTPVVAQATSVGLGIAGLAVAADPVTAPAPLTETPALHVVDPVASVVSQSPKQPTLAPELPAKADISNPDVPVNGAPAVHVVASSPSPSAETTSIPEPESVAAPVAASNAPVEDQAVIHELPPAKSESVPSNDGSAQEPQEHSISPILEPAVPQPLLTADISLSLSAAAPGTSTPIEAVSTPATQEPVAAFSLTAEEEASEVIDNAPAPISADAAPTLVSQEPVVESIPEVAGVESIAEAAAATVAHSSKDDSVLPEADNAEIAPSNGHAAPVVGPSEPDVPYLADVTVAEAKEPVSEVLAAPFTEGPPTSPPVEQELTAPQDPFPITQPVQVPRVEELDAHLPENTSDAVSLAPVPVVEASPPPIAENEGLSPPINIEDIPSQDPALEAPAVEDTSSGLPPAPESVVLEGSTPGPQIALDSSEPTTVAEIKAATAEPADDDTTAPSSTGPEFAPVAEEAAHPVANGHSEAELTLPIPQPDDVEPNDATLNAHEVETQP